MSIISDDIRARQTQLIDLWITDLRVRDKAEATVDTYTEAVRRAHRELSYGLAGSTTEELQAWIWQPNRAPATRATYRAAIRSFLSWAAERGHTDFDASAHLPTVKVPAGQPRPADSEVLADIIARAREPFRLWVLLAAGMGLRCVEISRLDREQIAEKQTWVQGKGGTNIHIPTHPAVWAAVLALPAGPVARRIDGRRATRQQVYQRANEYIARLGHDGVTMHQLRHWYGTEVYRAAGKDILVAKKALRHANVTHTQRYVATEDTDLIAAQRAIPLPI